MMVAGAVVLGAGVAHADVETTPLDPLDPLRIVSPLTIVQGDGVKIGEGTAIYPQVGLETGYESNTFYTNDNPIGAGVLRLLVEAGLGSLSPQRLQDSAVPVTMASQGSLIYDASAYASYDQYLSSTGAVTDQSGLGLGFHGKIITNPQGTLSFQAQEGFDRVLRPLNFETHTNANRDLNYAMLRLDIHPAWSRLSGAVMYVNQLDLFEQDLGYPSRILNTMIGRLAYQLFPLTSAYVQVSEGFDTGVGSSSAAKVDSYPLMAVAGLTSALGLNTSILAQAGYTKGFYSTGPDFSDLTALAYFEYRYNPISAVRFQYMYDHQDSINANFYRDHAFSGWLEHKFMPFALYISPEVRLREYTGINGMTGANAVRDDVILAAAVGGRYQYRNWMTASVEYRVVDDSTNYTYMVTGGSLNPSYVRHEAWAGVRLAY